MLNAATLIGLALWTQQFGGSFGPGIPGVPAPVATPASPGLPAPPTAPVAMPPTPNQGDLPRGLASPPPYGAAGSSEITGALALAIDGRWGAALGYRRFLAAGLAPGLAVAYDSFDTSNDSNDALEEIWLLASLRIVPLRIPRFALALTPQAGRVFVWGYSDGWTWGGSAAAVFALTPHFNLEAGVEFFFFGPAAFSSSISSSAIYRPMVGVSVLL